MPLRKKSEFETLYESQLEGCSISQEVITRAANEALYLLIRKGKEHEEKQLRSLRIGREVSGESLPAEENDTPELERLDLSGELRQV